MGSLGERRAYAKRVGLPRPYMLLRVVVRPRLPWKLAQPTSSTPRLMGE